MFFRRTREELAKLKEERKQFKAEKDEFEKEKEQFEELKQLNEKLRQEASKQMITNRLQSLQSLKTWNRINSRSRFGKCFYPFQSASES